MLYFCRRGRQNLRQLKKTDFSFNRDSTCNGPCVPYLMLSLSRLRDHLVLCHYLHHYFRACASVSFRWFDHVVPLQPGKVEVFLSFCTLYFPPFCSLPRGDERPSHNPLFRTILSKWVAHVTIHFDRVSECSVRPFDESSVIYLHCIDLSTEKFTPVTSFACMEICCVLGHFSSPSDLAVRRFVFSSGAKNQK